MVDTLSIHSYWSLLSLLLNNTKAKTSWVKLNKVFSGTAYKDSQPIRYTFNSFSAFISLSFSESASVSFAFFFPATGLPLAIFRFLFWVFTATSSASESESSSLPTLSDAVLLTFFFTLFPVGLVECLGGCST